MIDEKKIAQYNMEMAIHANGAAQILNALIDAKFVIQEQVYEIADYVMSQTKRNIESYPYASKEDRTRRYVIEST